MMARLRFTTSHLARAAMLAGAGMISLAPAPALACACGCGVFEVGTASLFATDHGGTAFLEYDFMDQDHNWSGTSSAPAGNNDDKDLRTDFFTAGAEYMFNSSWGVMAEVPVWNRYFKTDDGLGIDSFEHAALGDIRLMGIYSGFSDDMSTGIKFGVKLATGDWKYPNFDRDTEIGTGSTDLLLGAYHFGALTNDDAWVWFGQASLDQPIATQGGYRPGWEVDGAVGVTYDGLTVGGDIKVAPVLQLVGSHRDHDSGPQANPDDSGYDRLLVAPGIEVDVQNWKLYGDVEFPIFQNMNGNQLAAPALFKLIVSRSFD